MDLHHGRPLSRRDVRRRDGRPQRIFQHQEGTGSDFCARYKLDRLVWAERGESMEDCIAHEKRVKRWRREWKFALVERGNPDWFDLYALLA